MRNNRWAFFVQEYGVSPARPAPSQLRQDRKVAAAGGCSGAMQIAYPFFFAAGDGSGGMTRGELVCLDLKASRQRQNH